MTHTVPVQPGDPRRPQGPRDPGDAWVEGERGRFWGRFGAAGILVHDPDRGVLLQHRVVWSDQGGTWGLPGGALHQGEDAVTGALREAAEEAGVPADRIRVLFTSVFTVDYWSYTTVVAEATAPFEPHIADAESIELRWVPVHEVEKLPLHTGFAAAWPHLRPALHRRHAVVVDAANVVGSRPDGWWKDRRKANQSLVDRLAVLARHGLPATALGESFSRIWPDLIVVTEGQAKGVADASGVLSVVGADRDGDQAIVVAVKQSVAADATVHVVTADRELQQRVERRGAHLLGPGWLLNQLDAS
jgi:8-oxo-dGTP diphosphatase